MTVTIEQIKSLRDRTGVSMQACKKALEECGGDEVKAIEFLRKRGEAKMVSRSDRSTGEGVIVVAQTPQRTVMVKVSCETDFTARSDEFINFAEHVVKKIAGSSGTMPDFSTELTDISSKVGEKIAVDEPVVMTDPLVGYYIHTNRKLAAMVGFSLGTPEMARDVAMHITASWPRTVKPEEVDQADVDKEREIWIEELKKQNKPENLWESIMKGKEKKFREEQSLLTQPFVKNPDITVSKYLEATAPGVEVHDIMRLAI